MHLKTWIYRTSLRKRMWVSFAGLTVLCIAVTGLCSYVIAARAMERNSTQLNHSVLNQSVNVLDQKLKQIVVASSTMTLSETYKQTIRDIQADNRGRYFANFSLLQGLFTQAELTENSIDSILISTPSGDFYSSGKTRKTDVPFNSTDIYQRIKDEPETRWIESHEDELFTGKEEVVTLVLQSLTETYVPDVFLIVNVDARMLGEAVSEGLNPGSAHFLLINTSGASVLGDQGRPAWTKSPEFIGKLAANRSGNFEYKSLDGTMLVSYATSAFATDWMLVSYLSKSDLLAPVHQIQWLVLAIMAFCTLMALLLARYLSGLLLSPLLRLQKTMKRVEHEDLEARFASPFQDEIGEAGRKFNQMLDRIGQLIAEVKASENEKRKAEIKALQAQIDPHFLYNTLNTIYWKCEMDEYEDVKAMVLSLSALFRLGLNQGKEITTLGKELEHARQYLNLQQQCYEGLFEFSIHAPPELLELPVLKIIIQPLVENSILHGLKDRREAGLIRIAAESAGGNLVISVTDNGAGLDAERMNEKLRLPADGKGYALSNICNRLALYYGKGAGLRFFSRPGETIAVLTMPMESEGDEPWNVMTR